MRSRLARLAMPFDGEFDQAIEERWVGQPTGLPEARIHRDVRESRQAVELVDPDGSVAFRDEEVDPGEARSLEHLKGLAGRGAADALSWSPASPRGQRAPYSRRRTSTRSRRTRRGERSRPAPRLRVLRCREPRFRSRVRRRLARSRPCRRSGRHRRGRARDLPRRSPCGYPPTIRGTPV